MRGYTRRADDRRVSLEEPSNRQRRAPALQPGRCRFETEAVPVKLADGRPCFRLFGSSRLVRVAEPITEARILRRLSIDGRPSLPVPHPLRVGRDVRPFPLYPLTVSAGQGHTHKDRTPRRPGTSSAKRGKRRPVHEGYVRQCRRSQFGHRR